MERKTRDTSIIDKIIIHCSDSDSDDHDHINVIRGWHKTRGFYDVGYHYFIRRSGQIQRGRQLYLVGAHCYGQNETSVGVCLAGRSSFTDAQMMSTQLICRDINDILSIAKNSYDIVYPHSYFCPEKTCPNFEITDIFDFTDAEIIAYKEDKHPLDPF